MIKIVPTDTCYGLASEFLQEDFEEIYKLKWREISKKLAFVVKDFDELDKIAKISEKQKNFLKNYTFPFSVLLPPNENYGFPKFLKIENYSLISVRIWEKIFPKEIIENLNFPLFLTSANISWQKEAKTFNEAQKIFPNIFGFDGGICDNLPSNIFSFNENNEPDFLRKNYK